VLIVNENESVPHDRRVWQEALTLARSGHEVSIICPQGEGPEREASDEREGVRIHRYPSRPAAGGVLGYVVEYGWAFVQTARLIRRLSRNRPFDVVHVCNPPDILGVAALPLKMRGTSLIFDHHDLVPELYLSRFARGRDPGYHVAKLLERLAFALADVVISTNESYRKIAITRGAKKRDDVFVVRNDPDVDQFRRGKANDSLRHGKKYLIAYAGVMGPQDGVDHAVRALAALRERRDDWHAVFAGDGDALEQVRHLCAELGLEQSIDFLGWLGDEELLTLLSTADVCLAPDPRNPLNDVSTMVKVLEYMAMGCPIVSYDLPESLFSAGDAALYAPSGDIEQFATRIDELLDDPQLRSRLAAAGRARTECEFSWAASERELLAAYARAREKRRPPNLKPRVR
jgi:glycosyltransferase involved in cell wall biosynthesis